MSEAPFKQTDLLCNAPAELVEGFKDADLTEHLATYGRIVAEMIREDLEQGPVNLIIPPKGGVLAAMMVLDQLQNTEFSEDPQINLVFAYKQDERLVLSENYQEDYPSHLVDDVCDTGGLDNLAVGKVGSRLKRHYLSAKADASYAARQAAEHPATLSVPNKWIMSGLGMNSNIRNLVSADARDNTTPYLNVVEARITALERYCTAMLAFTDQGFTSPIQLESYLQFLEENMLDILHENPNLVLTLIKIEQLTDPAEITAALTQLFQSRYRRLVA